MKPKLPAFSRKYLDAMRSHWKQGPDSNLQAAGKLGGQAAAGGLDAVDLARIHGDALIALFSDSSPRSSDGMLRRANAFFVEALTAVQRSLVVATRERVEMIGGTLCVDSAPGKETLLRVEIPHRRTAKKFPSKISGHATLKCS